MIPKFLPKSKNYRNLLLLAGILVIFIVTPLTVLLSQQSEQVIKNPQAATTLPLSVDQLVATRPDHANPHAITFCDPPLYYSWGQHGTEDSKYKHSDSWTLGSWYAVHRDCSILNNTLNARFNIRRIAIWNHQPSTNTWAKTYDGLPNWNVNTDPAYGSYVDNAPKVESDGSYSFVIPPGRSLHGAQGTWPHINEGDGVITIIEARLLGSVADLAAAAKVGATAGADYRDANATGGDSSPGYYQSGFGQISFLNGNWQAYYMLSSTLTDAQVLANPPAEFTKNTTTDNPPTVSITSPANGATITAGTNVDINASASDDKGVSKVDISVDGTIKCSPTASPYTCPWNTTGLSGTHTIYAVATDTIGQKTQSTTITVTIGGGTISSCNTTFPTDKFHVCFFGSMDPTTGPFLGERDEGTVTSPAPTSATPILHDYLATGEFGVTDNLSGVWRGTINFPSGNYIFTATGDDGVRLDIGDNGSYEINQWIDQPKTSYQSAPITLNGPTKVRFEWYDHLYNAYASLGWSQVTVNTAKIGDLNGDNLVNGADLAILLSRWGSTDPTADLNKDGKVGSADLAILLAHWGS